MSLPGRVRLLAWELGRQLPGVDAEDLEQEATIAIWRAGATDPSLQTVIGRRRIIDVARSVTGRHPGPRRRPLVPLDTPDLPLPGQGEDEALHVVVLDQVMADIDRLPARDRDLLLTGLTGQTLDEAAAPWGIGGARASQIRTETRRQLKQAHG